MSPASPIRSKQEPMSEHHPDVDSPTETRYELTTETQRGALKRLQAAHAAAMQRADAVARDAQSGFLQGIELLLAGMGAETQGKGVRIEGNTLVVVTPDAVASPAGTHSH